jgi:hypothetical protein
MGCKGLGPIGSHWHCGATSTGTLAGEGFAKCPFLTCSPPLTVALVGRRSPAPAGERIAHRPEIIGIHHLPPCIAVRPIIVIRFTAWHAA